jgi:abortive infection Abi-like protein
MASEILKSSARVLDEFNYVRNNQSLAHDNPELINKGEAYFIYQSVAASIRFLRELEETIRSARPVN